MNLILMWGELANTGRKKSVNASRSFASSFDVGRKS